jgi:AraC-like DNA-binding protein
VSCVWAEVNRRSVALRFLQLLGPTGSSQQPAPQLLQLPGTCHTEALLTCRGPGTADGGRCCDLDRGPTVSEVAEELGWPESRVQRLFEMQVSLWGVLFQVTGRHPPWQLHQPQ